MKKIFRLIMLVSVLIVLTGCSFSSKKNSKDLTKYNDIRVTFVTTQGDVSFYLYPEAAPTTVANFINLSLRGYYDNTTFHRAIENFIVQGGDPTGTGEGTPGYAIKDEFVDWLDFYQSGMLAMANVGPNTGGGQFFITLYPADFLNQKHTVFGEVVSQIDGEKSKKLEKGDVIKKVIIHGEADLLLSLNKDKVDEWNKILDKKYPKLKKYEVKPISSFGKDVQEYKEEIERIYTPKTKIKEEDKEYFVPRFIRGVEKKLQSKTK